MTRLTATRTFIGNLPNSGRDRLFHFGDDGLALLDGGAFQSNDQRHLEVHLPRGGDDAVGDDVAAHDAAEDVDQDALHCGIAQNDLERGGALFLGGAAADVEEVGRERAVQLDDVHRRHGEAGAVDHTADVSVELDVGEVVLGRLDLHR